MNGEAIESGQAGGTASQAGGGGPSLRTRPRASTLGYWLAAVIMLAGLIGGGVLVAVTGFGAYERLTDMPRASVPGDVAFDVTDTGEKLVYYIGEDGTSWRELGLTVTGPDGQAVQVKNYLFGTEVATIVTRDHHDASTTHPDFAVATFRADQTGGYEIATTAAAENGAEIAVGENLVWPVVFGVLGALTLVLGGVATGVVLIVVTAVRRSAPRAA